MSALRRTIARAERTAWKRAASSCADDVGPIKGLLRALKDGAPTRETLEAAHAASVRLERGLRGLKLAAKGSHA